MNPTWWQKFVLNAENQLKSGSTYIVGFGLAFLGLLSEWPDLAAVVDQLTGHHRYGAGIAVLVSALVAKFRPSNAMSSQLEAALLEIARIHANNVLQSHGINQEIPQAAAAAALPIIPVQIPLARAAPAAPVPTKLELSVTKSSGLNIDPNLLLSLVHDYLVQQKTAKQS